jgi:FixJ family two-component response regulator
MPKILPWVAVVDDEEPIRRALLRLLRSAGIRARAFASGAEFLASLPTSQPYCVVLDLNMPEMSGFDVLLSLKQSSAQIGVIVVTGHHLADIQARAMLAKPLAYLRKPMNDQILIDAIGLAFLQVCQR